MIKPQWTSLKLSDPGMAFNSWKSSTRTSPLNSFQGLENHVYCITSVVGNCACRTGCSGLPKYIPLLCMSWLDVASFRSQWYVYLNEQSWNSLNNSCWEVVSFAPLMWGLLLEFPLLWLVSPLPLWGSALCFSVTVWATSLVFPLESANREANLNPLIESTFHL